LVQGKDGLSETKKIACIDGDKSVKEKCALESEAQPELENEVIGELEVTSKGKNSCDMCVSIYNIDVAALLGNGHLDLVVKLVQSSQHVPLVYKKLQSSITTDLLNALLSKKVSVSAITKLLFEVDSLPIDGKAEFGKLSDVDLWKVVL